MGGKFPSVGVLERQISGFNLNQALRKESFINALERRGIDLPNKIDRTYELSSLQVSAVAAITNFNDKRRPATKLKELGITMGQWQGWLKNPKFRKYLHTLSSLEVSDGLYVAHQGLMDAMERGQVEAIKYYMEITGRAPKDSKQEQDIRTVLTRVMEAIQITVRDPLKIAEIGRQFDMIMNGGRTEQVDPFEGRRQIEGEIERPVPQVVEQFSVGLPTGSVSSHVSSHVPSHVSMAEDRDEYQEDFLADSL